MILFSKKKICLFQINVEVKTEGRNDKRINIVDVLKPADDVIERHNRERKRAFSGSFYRI